MPPVKVLILAILAAIAGVVFTSWVQPGTSGGYLLLLAMATAVFFVLFTALGAAVAGLRRRRVRTAPVAPSPGFASQRPRPGPADMNTRPAPADMTTRPPAADTPPGNPPT